MNHKIPGKNSYSEVTNLFTSAFTLSEDEKEGKLIGHLVSGLCSVIDNQDVICLCTYRQQTIIGSIFFTRLRFKKPVRVYMLAPVAVRTGHQGQGVGQTLIRYGLQELKNRSVPLVVTYGDPGFYSKVGFLPLPESVIQAPLKLSMPHGWLGQSLTGGSIATINERPGCVTQFNDPVYW
jgi:predicted N-acetyltransferase YhbS